MASVVPRTGRPQSQEIALPGCVGTAVRTSCEGPSAGGRFRCSDGSGLYVPRPGAVPVGCALHAHLPQVWAEGSGCRKGLLSTPLPCRPVPRFPSPSLSEILSMTALVAGAVLGCVLSTCSCPGHSLRTSHSTDEGLDVPGSVAKEEYRMPR